MIEKHGPAVTKMGDDANTKAPTKNAANDMNIANWWNNVHEYYKRTMQSNNNTELRYHKASAPTTISPFERS